MITKKKKKKGRKTVLHFTQKLQEIWQSWIITSEAPPLLQRGGVPILGLVSSPRISRLGRWWQLWALSGKGRPSGPCKIGTRLLCWRSFALLQRRGLMQPSARRLNLRCEWWRLEGPLLSHLCRELISMSAREQNFSGDAIPNWIIQMVLVNFDNKLDETFLQ